MADILIRDVPDDVLAALDAKARRMGLSRAELIRRTLARERGDAAGAVTVDHLARSAHAFRDVTDPDVMGGAWS